MKKPNQQESTQRVPAVATTNARLDSNATWTTDALPLARRPTALPGTAVGAVGLFIPSFLARISGFCSTFTSVTKLRSISRNLVGKRMGVSRRTALGIPKVNTL